MVNEKDSFKNNDKLYIIVHGLHEIYYETNKYELKFILNNFLFSSKPDVSFFIETYKKKDLIYSFEQWGRKINIVLKIEDNVESGKYTICLNALDNNKILIKNKFDFWVFGND